jgi:hypothetical protein
MNEEEEDGPGRRGQRHIPTLPFMLPMLHASCLCLCPVFGHRMQSKIRTCQHNERAEETEATHTEADDKRSQSKPTSLCLHVPRCAVIRALDKIAA